MPMKTLLNEGSRARASARASQYLIDHELIPTVEGERFVPDGDTIVTESGRKYANTYRAPDTSNEPERLSAEDNSRAEFLKQHICNVLCGDEQDGLKVLACLAHLIQKPGLKWGFALLFLGARGIGKSFLSRLLTDLLGTDNVSQVSPTVLGSQFNDGLAGKLVVVIEEVRLSGSNRHAVLDRLKPSITEPRIEFNRKFVPSYTGQNYANFICFTNDPDALPVDENDRRYFINASTLRTDKQVAEFNKADPRYFDRLYELRQHVPALRKWLREFDLTSVPGFDPQGRAPNTAAKVQMALQAADPAHHAIEDLLDSDAHPLVNRRFVHAPTLGKLLQSDSVKVTAEKTSKILIRMGFVSSRIQLSAGRKWTFHVIPDEHAVRGVGKEVIRAVKDAYSAHIDRANSFGRKP